VDPRASTAPDDLDELVPVPSSGRVYEERRRVGPADVTPDGRARLEVIACWLQDVAYHDVVDGGVEGAGFWIVRRTRIRVERFPRFTDELRVRTFVSGASRALAERRTRIDSESGVAIEAVSVWVNVDPKSHLPARLPGAFVETYAPAQARKPRSRLRHPPPPAGAQSEPWVFRAGDLDLAGHVNNTRYWAIVDELLVDPRGALPLDLEVEHRAAAQSGEARALRADGRLWVTAPEGEVYASAAVPGD
jgi:acyl-ACP thioesterase